MSLGLEVEDADVDMDMDIREEVWTVEDGACRDPVLEGSKASSAWRSWDSCAARRRFRRKRRMATMRNTPPGMMFSLRVWEESGCRSDEPKTDTVINAASAPLLNPPPFLGEVLCGGFEPALEPPSDPEVSDWALDGAVEIVEAAGRDGTNPVSWSDED